VRSPQRNRRCQAIKQSIWPDPRPQRPHDDHLCWAFTGAASISQERHREEVVHAVRAVTPEAVFHLAVAGCSPRAHTASRPIMQRTADRARSKSFAVARV
jgi:hypothetical protein